MCTLLSVLVYYIWGFSSAPDRKTGIVIITPEKKDELFARAVDYGFSRYVVGVHYLSDIEASKSAGAAIGNALLHNEAVLKAMEPVKAELRAAMGMM